MSPNPSRALHEWAQAEAPTTRLATAGPDALSIRELLALTLGGPRALKEAAALLDRVGEQRLLRASAPELQQVYGIGPARAARLVAALALAQRLVGERSEKVPRITSPADAANLLMAQMVGQEQEQFVVLLLNTKNDLMQTVWLYQGSLNSCVVRTAEVFRDAVRLQAAAILVAHSHPSGDPTPSTEDIRVTRDLRQAGELLDIALLDHVVFGHQRYVSMKERSLGF